MEITYDGVVYQVEPAGPSMATFKRLIGLSGAGSFDEFGADNIGQLVASIDGGDPEKAPMAVQWLAFMRCFNFLSKVFGQAQDETQNDSGGN